MSLNPRTLVAAPTSEPVLLDEMKAQLNLTTDFTDDDEYIESLITAVRENIEDTLNRGLMTQTWDMNLDSFPEVIEIPKAPLQSITSIKYYDTDGVEQTLSTSVYTVDSASDPGRVYLAYSQEWPTHRDIRKAITVRFVAGYTSAANVPAPIKHALKIVVSDLYKDRESYVTGTIVSSFPDKIRMMLNPYKVTVL